jgi:hypothetical protein
LIEALFTQLLDGMIETIGSPELSAIIIMGLLFLLFVFCGLEVDYSLVMISPIPYAFYQGGYIEIWISALFMVIPLGFGIYMIWVKMSNR